MAIHVDQASLARLESALGTAGSEFKTNYGKVTALVDNITSGNLKGPVADKFQALYAEKKPLFDKVLSTINEAEEYIKQEKGAFERMMSDLQSTMR